MNKQISRGLFRDLEVLSSILAGDTFIMEILMGLRLGFPFIVTKLFTSNIVTDVIDGYYVGITVVMT